MEIIKIDINNIETEHICCAITEKKGENCVASKKAWLTERFEDGLVFRKLDARGKVFIEYIPAEKAWCPIEAPGYMHINCFWVSGQYKGQGYASALLNECIEDAKAQGFCGLTVLSSAKKMPFLSDPKFLKYKGFEAADQAEPFFELLFLKFDENAPTPHFKDCAKKAVIDESGMVLYYTDQCPHTAKYAPLLAEIAEEHGCKLTLHKITTTEDAQNAPIPTTTYSFFYNGKFVTNEIYSEKKFIKYLETTGQI